MIIENIFLSGRNLGAINMDLPCQLFPQNMMFLLSACKQDEGKGQAEAHAKGRSHQSDVSVLLGPSPPPQGKSSWLGAQLWMSSLLIWLMPWTHTVYPDPWYSAPLLKEALSFLSLYERKISTSLSLQKLNQEGKVTTIIYFYHHFPNFFSSAKLSSYSLMDRVVIGRWVCFLFFFFFELWCYSRSEDFTS